MPSPKSHVYSGTARTSPGTGTVNEITCSAAGVVEKIVNKFTNDTPGGADTTVGDGIRFRTSS